MGDEKKKRSKEERTTYLDVQGYNGLDVQLIDFVTKDLNYILQTDLFDVNGVKIKNREYGLRVKQGRFFENVVQGMVGGGKKKVYFSISDPYYHSIAEFDVRSKNSKYIEVKSAKNDNEVKLSDPQNLNYAFCLQRDLLEGTMTIDFYMFVHGLKDLQSNRRYTSNIDHLIEGCSQNILFGVVLPFSAIFKLWDPLVVHSYRIDPRTGKQRYRWNDEKWLSRIKKNAQKPYTRLPSRLLEELLLDPEKGLESLGFNSEYSYERRICPENVMVGIHQLTPFPMISFKDKNVVRWNEEFMEVDLRSYFNFIYPPYPEGDDKKSSDDLGPLFPLEEAERGMSQEPETTEEISEPVGKDSSIPF